MDVSIIIVTYNCADYIITCLQSVYEETKNVSFEIIVSDNNSTDNSLQLIENRFHDIQIVRNSNNIGFGAANNIAAKRAKGKYLLLLNPDTILINNAVKIFFDFLQNNTGKIGCIGGNLLDNNGKPSNIGGHFPSLFQLFSDIGFRCLYPGFYRRKVTLMLTVETMPRNMHIDYVCGAALFLDKKMFDEMQGFDENYFLYFEDTDLCFRLKQSCYTNCIVPDARIIHLESVSTGSNDGSKISEQKFKFFEKSKQLFFRKSYGKTHVFFVKILTVFYLFSKGIVHLENPVKYFKLSFISLCMNSKT